MKTNKSIHSKKSYEEHEDEICNFNSFESDDKQMELRRDLKSSSGKKKSRKGSHSRISTKIDSLNVSSNSNNVLVLNSSGVCHDKTGQKHVLDLIDSLKDKLSIYENEIRALIDEKLQMQVTINNLQIANCNTLKKSTRTSKQLNDSNSIPLAKSTESAFEINRNYINEAKGLNQELKILNTNIQRQQALLDQNNSILDETILGYGDSSSNMCVNCIKHKHDALKLNEEKEEIMNELQKLKDDFLQFLEGQNKAQANEESQCVEGENFQQNPNNTNEEVVKNSVNTTKVAEMVMPNIEQFFVLKNKFQLVDSEKNLFHMKKCKKFEAFKTNNREKEISSEEILGAFLEMYQTNMEAKNDNTNSLIKIETDLDEGKESEKEKKIIEKDTSYNISDTD